MNHATPADGREPVNLILKVLGRNARRLIAAESQEEIARRSHLSQKTISNIVNDKNVRITALEGLGHALRVPPFALVIDGDFSSPEAQAMEQLLLLFLKCKSEGRQQITRIAEAEARIASMPTHQAEQQAAQLE